MNAALRYGRLVIVALALVATLTSTVAASAQAQVRTIAGSGLSGFRDGPAADAQFMMPVSVAVGADDDVYVADAAAQRIFRITRAGMVEIVAGSGDATVPGVYAAGGYRDGVASLAQFNHPSAVAVGADGIYVADMGNHCIRRIANGVVSTYAGSPQRMGTADGNRLSATFSYPRALLFDSGTLYVADASAGVRAIDANGTVSSLALPPKFDKRVTSMAFVGAGSNRKLIIANVRGFLALDSHFGVLWERHVKPRYSEALYDPEGKLIKSSVRANRDPVGLPFAIVALEDNTVAYVDPHINAVRTLDVASAAGTSSILNGVGADAPFAGGFTDGPITSAAFDSPMGITRSSDGGLIIADTGNRRVRKLEAGWRGARPSEALDPHVRLHDVGGRRLMVPKHLVPIFDRGVYRIMYLGNSSVFWDTHWDDSIPGILEARLADHFSTIGLPRRPEVAVAYILPTFQAIESYATLTLNLGTADCLVVQLNVSNVLESYPLGNQDLSQYFANTRAKIIASVRRLSQRLSANRVPVVFVLHPGPGELTPLESVTAQQDLAPTRSTGYYSLGFQEYTPPTATTFLAAVLKEAGVALIDVTPDFRAYEQSGNRLPLFGTLDYHFTPAGRQLVADRVAAGLERLRPWTNVPSP